jgi:hypothetical protein
MMNKRAIDILRELVAIEDACILSRMVESTFFVGPALAGGDALIRRMARDVVEHRGWLIHLLAQRGTMPGPRRSDLRTADLHFMDEMSALPRIVANLEDVVRKYAAAGALLASSAPWAVDTVSRIAQRHRANLEALRKLAASGAVAT